MPITNRGPALIRVLFAERVIPNYRLGAFRLLASRPGIHLTVSYWSHRPPDEPPHIDNPSGFEVVEFSPLQWDTDGRLRWFNFSLLSYIFRHRPDVVIAGFATFGTNSLVNYCLERLCTVLAGTRFIYRVSAALPSGNGRWGRALRQRWHALYYRRATILAYGGRAAQEIVQQGCSPDRISIDYNSMDTRQLHRLRQKYETDRDAWQREFLVEYGLERPGYVLFASRIYEAKRVDVLINAWRLVVEQLPSAHLVILGSGEKKADAVRQAADLGSSVTFVNGIYDHDLLARFYILASLVVFPGCASLSTHFAMCFGRPVVCSNRGGNELEYVLDGENGLLFNYGDSRDLAEKLLELLRNSDLRQQYGNRADSLVREKINIDHMVDVIAETIRRVHDGALSSAYCE